MISRAEAQRYIDDYFSKHKSVKAYLDEQIKIGERDYAVKTIMGRIRQIPEFASRKYMDRQFANRLAMNTPIQGTAADIIKIAMISAYNYIEESKVDAKLLLQVHDELIFDVSKDILEELNNEKVIHHSNVIGCYLGHSCTGGVLFAEVS